MPAPAKREKISLVRSPGISVGMSSRPRLVVVLRGPAGGNLARPGMPLSRSGSGLLLCCPERPPGGHVADRGPAGALPLRPGIGILAERDPLRRLAEAGDTAGFLPASSRLVLDQDVVLALAVLAPPEPDPHYPASLSVISGSRCAHHSSAWWWPVIRIWPGAKAKPPRLPASPCWLCSYSLP